MLGTAWLERKRRDGSLVLVLASSAGLSTRNLRGENDTAIRVGQDCPTLRQEAMKIASRGALTDRRSEASNCLVPAAFFAFAWRRTCIFGI